MSLTLLDGWEKSFNKQIDMRTAIKIQRFGESDALVPVILRKQQTSRQQWHSQVRFAIVTPPRILGESLFFYLPLLPPSEQTVRTSFPQITQYLLSHKQALYNSFYLSLKEDEDVDECSCVPAPASRQLLS